MCKSLYLFVEGTSDKRLIEHVLKYLQQRASLHYNFFYTIEYAQKQDKFTYLQNFIRSLNSMSHDYLLFTDLNSAPCVTHVKQLLTNKIPNLSPSNIIVVKREIESWYVAGIDDNLAKKLKITKPLPQNTETFSKEDLMHLKPPSFQFLSEFMLSILEDFSVETATKKNASFAYFISRLSS